LSETGHCFQWTFSNPVCVSQAKARTRNKTAASRGQKKSGARPRAHLAPGSASSMGHHRFAGKSTHARGAAQGSRRHARSHSPQPLPQSTGDAFAFACPGSITKNVTYKKFFHLTHLYLDNPKVAVHCLYKQSYELHFIHVRKGSHTASEQRGYFRL